MMKSLLLGILVSLCLFLMPGTLVGCINSSGRKPSGFGLLALKPGREMGR